MLALNIIKFTVLTTAGSLLIVNLTACGPGDTPTVASTDSGIKSSYDAGYELGIKLALLQQKNPDTVPDDAISGLCDALTETGLQMNDAELCSGRETATSTDTAAVASNTAPTVSTQSQAPVNARANSSLDDFARLNARRDGVVVLPSSVQYEVLKEGNGNKPVSGDTVVISYEASLPDGHIFDTTYDDGEPLHMQLEKIAIPGLREALQLMPAGSQWRVIIPPKMGFGRSGNNQLRRRDVIYEIELVSIDKSEEEASSVQ